MLSFKFTALTIQALILGSNARSVTITNATQGYETGEYPGYEWPSAIRCGIDWEDAFLKCGEPCFSDVHCSVPGERCFGDLEKSTCDDFPNPNPLPDYNEPTQYPRPNIKTGTNRKLAYLATYKCGSSGLSDPACDIENPDYYGEVMLDNLNPEDIDAYLLAFSAWEASSGGFTIKSTNNHLDIPTYDRTYIERSYLTWTTLKHVYNTNMIAAFGGDTLEGIWDSLSSSNNRAAIANALVNLLNTDFPVYKKNADPFDEIQNCQSYNPDGSCARHHFQIVGYVRLDGLDFDLERQNTSITQELQENVIDLVDRIKNHPNFPSTAALCLTTVHVGADPVSCRTDPSGPQCSVPTISTHSGEVIYLLQNSRNYFDFFNLMAYDAGQSFQYEVAMDNMQSNLGNSKARVVLGNSRLPQFGGFTESRQNNIARARWQNANNYGGFFLWNMGDSSDGSTIEDHIEYFQDMSNAAS